MRYFGLIGYPLGHSFSKKYFTEKFEKEGIPDAIYDLFPLPDIQDLPTLIQNTPGIAGLNVTIPHKQAVIPFLTSLDDTARAIGAVNVIRIRGQEWKGYNSDAVGFEDTLRTWLQSNAVIKTGADGTWIPQKPIRAYVPGTGGASKAVTYVLSKHQIDWQLVSRNPEHGQIGYDALPEKMAFDGFRLWINCTPAGTFPNVAQMPPVPVEYFDKNDLVYDLIYNPEETLLMQKAAQKGAVVLNGLPMLYGQAEAAWKIWNEK